MIRRIQPLLLAILMSLLAASAIAEQLDASALLAKQKAGATADALVALVNDPANTIAIKADDLAALKSGGVPDAVIAAIQQRIAAQPGTAAAAQAVPATPASPTPDDARLTDIVKIVKAGISENLIAEQIKQSGLAYKLTMNDMIYLKQNGVQDSVIAALLATKAAAEKAVPAAPSETVYTELLLVRGWGPMKRERPGRLVLKNDTFSWIDGADPKENFEFNVNGLEKIWYTCEAQTAGDVCYQLNFQVVKGPRYSFADVSRTSGSNTTVKAIMERLRKDYPRAPFAANDH